MGRGWVLPPALALGICLRAAAASNVCGIYHNVFENEILPKIKAGVPFELMSADFVDGRLAGKKAIRVSFNLWDEIVTIQSGQQVLAHFPILQGERELCRFLEIDDEMSKGRHYTYRLLLNPLWSERITRLQVASADTVSNGRIVAINWQKLASEMPADKVLIEREFEK